MLIQGIAKQTIGCTEPVQVGKANEWPNFPVYEYNLPTPLLRNGGTDPQLGGVTCTVTCNL